MSASVFVKCMWGTYRRRLIKRCTSVRMNVKLKEIAYVNIIDVDKLIWAEGLSVDERGRLVA